MGPTFTPGALRVCELAAEIASLLTPKQPVESNKMEAEHRKQFRHEHMMIAHPDMPPPEAK